MEKKRATYEDLLELPEHLVGEIVDGELVVSPRPAPLHAKAGSAIGGDLNSPFDRAPGGSGGPGGWHVLYEPELHLHGDVLVPDLAGWRRERMPRLPKTAFFELAPDWVCEVLSPSTARIDRIKKRRIYAREGIAWLWMVDPIARTLEVFQLERERWVLAAAHGAVEKVRAEPFAAVEIELERWWPENE